MTKTYHDFPKQIIPEDDIAFLNSQDNAVIVFKNGDFLRTRLPLQRFTDELQYKKFIQVQGQLINVDEIFKIVTVVKGMALDYTNQVIWVEQK